MLTAVSPPTADGETRMLPTAMWWLLIGLGLALVGASSLSPVVRRSSVSLLPIRRITATLLAAALCAACSSSDDAPSATASTSTTTTTPVVLYTEAQCAEKATASAKPLQDFVDQYQGLSAQEWNALDPPPDIKAVQDQVVAIAQDGRRPRMRYDQAASGA